MRARADLLRGLRVRDDVLQQILVHQIALACDAGLELCRSIQSRTRAFSQNIEGQMNALEFNAIGAEQWARTNDRTHANAYYFQQQTKKAHPKVRVRHEVQQTRPVLLGQQVPQPRKHGVSHKVRELKVKHKLLYLRQERKKIEHLRG